LRGQTQASGGWAAEAQKLAQLSPRGRAAKGSPGEDRREREERPPELETGKDGGSRRPQSNVRGETNKAGS
jgi:hypothetical protein